MSDRLTGPPPVGPAGGPTLTRLIGAALAGVLLGLACLIILVVGSILFAYLTGSSAELPGVFSGWFTEENGMPALSFDPHWPGMLAVVAVIATLTVAGAWLRLRRRGAA